MALAVVSLAQAACSTAPFVWVDDARREDLSVGPYRIRAGDRLAVDVWNQQPLSREVVVRGDGLITLPLIGEVPAASKEPQELAADVTKRLEGLVVDARVSVTLVQSSARRVSVLGEVREPGVFELAADDTVLHALARAGGMTEFAKNDGVYVVRAGETRVRFDYQMLSSGEGQGLLFALRDGDVIVVE